MYADVRQAVALIEEQDRGAVERFLTQASEVARDAENWNGFIEGLRSTGADDRVLSEFVERADREFSHPFDAVRRFGDYRPEELLAARDEALAGPRGDGLDGPAAFDRDGFTAFLDANEHSWQQTWPESRDWMVYQAGQSGFTAEAAAFVEYVDATSLADALIAYGAAAIEGLGAPEGLDGLDGPAAFDQTGRTTPDPIATSTGTTPTPTQAASDAMALGRRAVEELQTEFPDLVVTDDQLATILDHELRAAAVN